MVTIAIIRILCYVASAMPRWKIIELSCGTYHCTSCSFFWNSNVAAIVLAPNYCECYRKEVRTGAGSNLGVVIAVRNMGSCTALRCEDVDTVARIP